MSTSDKNDKAAKIAAALVEEGIEADVAQRTARIAILLAGKTAHLDAAALEKLSEQITAKWCEQLQQRVSPDRMSLLRQVGADLTIGFIGSGLYDLAKYALIDDKGPSLLTFLITGAIGGLATGPWWPRFTKGELSEAQFATRKALVARTERLIVANNLSSDEGKLIRELIGIISH